MAKTYEKSRARLQAKQTRAAAHNPEAAIELIRVFPASDFRGSIFGGFWPIQSEIDIRPLLTALHHMDEQIALPCTPRKGLPLTFRSWSPQDALKRGAHGTWEPRPDKVELTPDIIFVPMLAFTPAGERLGYGGGYYDRTLERLKSQSEVLACGVAYAAQEAPTLPTDVHDVRLDAVLTETEFKVFK